MNLANGEEKLLKCEKYKLYFQHTTLDQGTTILPSITTQGDIEIASPNFLRPQIEKLQCTLTHGKEQLLKCAKYKLSFPNASIDQGTTILPSSTTQGDTEIAATNCPDSGHDVPIRDMGEEWLLKWAKCKSSFQHT